jgi:histidine triad (HIT) family protein
MNDCIFCKIASKQIPSKIIYEDEVCIAFDDISPQAPVHSLVIPKKHIEKISDITESDVMLIGKISLVINKIADLKNITKDGYRIVVNCGEFAGQAVNHLHFHLLGGRRLKWPPG